MVFHRFLNNEVPGRSLRIYINDRKITAWDPYCRQEENTQQFESVKLDLNNNGKVGSITLQPYVLPPEKKFSSKDAFLAASGPKKWNRQQGFYIYRANRMIQSGGWAGIRTIDEHLKLARISLDFTSYLDDYFNLNISKMQVTIPKEVKEQISLNLNNVVKHANQTYRKKTETTNRPVQSDHTPPTNYPDPPHQNPIPPKPPSEVVVVPDDSNSKKLWRLDEIKTYLLCIAKEEETEIIERLFNELSLELEKDNYGS
jgi:hypothetical protein